jgi:Integrase core domain
VAQVVALRRQRWTGARIAPAVALSRATVGRILRRVGLARLRQLEPGAPVQRYERARPGELLHVDIKKLGRIAGIGHRITGDWRHRARGIGWEYVHVAIDDCSRLAYAEVLLDERGVTVAAFLRRACRWFARRGVQILRVLSDNGSATSRTSSPPPARPSKWPTAAPGRIALRPMARPSASDPFRRWIVYPSLLRSVRATWTETFGTA